MRDVVFFVPKKGYDIVKVGCGCQQIRVQVSYAGQIAKMKNQLRETQKKCNKLFMNWNTQFFEETFSQYHARAQRIADDVERQCQKSTLELNSLTATEERTRRYTEMVMNQNSAYLGKL